ncbi:MAG: hypothetical protein COY58_09500 [Gammaproteobacteria bacterium CG_4_10_14_0_8_um_filter_38_16]|nr:MAG: hypothetical protein COY58_09500 [Gammaproteobacteria bacterium CG_4_10_14_0_8_um_filter_38_16]PJA03077.1 MAG: hypothetical protein COX72_07165 [Gammaproteobacteria bacterium CG_4_10_14_0_2_um_filter_38_22]PJB10127.1 MAG: hypothetical protein CO120_06530 [Gammaproteobacteria bacterium CG_4_9_14_3_um_filter_38_9]
MLFSESLKAGGGVCLEAKRGQILRPVLCLSAKYNMLITIPSKMTGPTHDKFVEVSSSLFFAVALFCVALASNVMMFRMRYPFFVSILRFRCANVKLTQH